MFQELFCFFLDKRSITVFVDFFCLTVQKNCVGQHFSVSLIFGYCQKLSIIGVYYDFLTKIFYLTAPKIFVGETLCVSEKSWYQNILDIRSITIFCQFLCFHDTQKFRGGTLKCFTISGYRELVSILGLYHDSRLNFFCLTVPKSFVREPFSVPELFWYQKLFEY